jgi:hypothetical protein
MLVGPSKTTFGNIFPCSCAEETSPPISMKSKIGVNFMVTVGRALDTGENALAKLLQASQDMVRFFYFLKSVFLFKFYK